MKKRLMGVVFAVMIAAVMGIVYADGQSFHIQQTEDDAREDSGTMLVDSTINVHGIEWGTTYRSGLRYDDVMIPKGAIITNAYIAFGFNSGSGTDNAADIYGEDTDNSNYFTSTPNDITDRTKTTAKVDWDSIPLENTNSPNISIIIQEIINRAGWQPGNPITILLYEDAGASDEWESGSYDNNPDTAPVLYIEYTRTVPDTGARTIFFDHEPSWYNDILFELNASYVNSDCPKAPYATCYDQFEADLDRMYSHKGVNGVWLVTQGGEYDADIDAEGDIEWKQGMWDLVDYRNQYDTVLIS